MSTSKTQPTTVATVANMPLDVKCYILENTTASSAHIALNLKLALASIIILCIAVDKDFLKAMLRGSMHHQSIHKYALAALFTSMMLEIGVDRLAKIR